MHKISSVLTIDVEWNSMIEDRLLVFIGMELLTKKPRKLEM